MQSIIAAYHERPSQDPITGARDLLREEWRLVPFREDDPEQTTRLIEAFGPCQTWELGRRPFPKTILEHRYIRRGVEEPWLPVAHASCDEGALQDIDPHATAVDPRLVAIQKERADYAAEKAREAWELSERDRAMVERQRRRAASRNAFDRLMESAGREWAIRWNEAVSSLATEERDRLKEDAEFVRLHDAVIDAVTVPTKRKAIREALAYLDQERLTQ